MAEIKTGNKNYFHSRHIYAMFFFVCLIVYHVLIANRLQKWELSDLTYSFLCVDFSFGVASKLLPGAIFRLLFGQHASKTIGSIYTLVLMTVFFLGLSFLLERFMLCVEERYKTTALVLLLLFITGGYTFSIFTKMLGILDSYWLYLALLFFFFLEHKILRFTIPLIFVCSLFVHFSAVVFVLLLLSVVLLYRLAIEESSKERWIYSVIFAVSVLLSIMVFFALLFHESNSICTMNEFHNKLKENGSEQFVYFDYSFFHVHIITGKEYIPESVFSETSPILKFFSLVYYQIKITYSLLSLNPQKCMMTVVVGIIIMLPIVFVFLRFLYEMAKQEKKILKKASYILMITEFPVIFALGLLFAISFDITRYYTYAFLSVFVSVLIVLYYEPQQTAPFFERLLYLKGELPVKLYALMYLSITLMPSV